MRWQHLVDGLDEAELSGDPSVEVTGITHDSRRVGPGTCFACIPGAHVDGHDFAAGAVDAGAAALLTERPLGLGVAEAVVPSVRRALGPVAAHFYGRPSAAMRCLGITGTNGKTTTTYLLEAIARAAGERTAVIGTVAARIGDDVLPAEHTTPEADDLQALLAHARDSGAGVVAMEVSSHALHQHRVDGTEFAAVCFTNLTHEHLDYHGTLDAYFEAKAALFTARFAPAAAVNVDDEHGRALAARLRARGDMRVVTYGCASGTDADLAARGVVLGATGSAFQLVDQQTWAQAPIASPLLGAFNVSNACAAAATALAAGFPFAAVVQGLRDRIVVPGRMEPVDGGPALHRARRLRPHPRRAGPGARRGPRDRHRRFPDGPGVGGVRLRRRPRHGQAPADGRGRRRRRRRGDRHLRQPAVGGPGGHRRGVRRRRARGGCRADRRARPPRRDRARTVRRP